MTDKHTPGPWEATDFRSGNWKIWDVVTGHTKYRNAICVVSAPKTAQTPEVLKEFEANARLIAAAPEIKEALEALIDSLETARPDGGVSASISKARAVLDRLKARGE